MENDIISQTAKDRRDRVLRQITIFAILLVDCAHNDHTEWERRCRP